MDLVGSLLIDWNGIKFPVSSHFNYPKILLLSLKVLYVQLRIAFRICKTVAEKNPTRNTTEKLCCKPLLWLANDLFGATSSTFLRSPTSQTYLQDMT